MTDDTVVPDPVLVEAVARVLRERGHSIRRTGQVFECSCGLIESMEVVTQHSAEVDATNAVLTVMEHGWRPQ